MILFQDQTLIPIDRELYLLARQWGWYVVLTFKIPQCFPSLFLMISIMGGVGHTLFRVRYDGSITELR